MSDSLEDLTGWVEYDVNGHLPEGDPLRCVAQARISDGIKYPRFEDDTYPHPYKPPRHWPPPTARTSRSGSTPTGAAAARGCGRRTAGTKTWASAPA